MTDPQNPFLNRSNDPQNPFSDPQNPFSSVVEDDPASIRHTLPAAIKAELNTILSFVMFPFDIMEERRMTNPRRIRQELERYRAFQERDKGTRFEGRFDTVVERMSRDLAEAESMVRAKAAKMRFQIVEARARQEQGLPPREERFSQQSKEFMTLLGIPDPKTGEPPPAEPGSMTELVSFITSMPGHLVTAYMNARSPTEQAEAIAGGVVAAGSTLAPFARARPVSPAKLQAAQAANYITQGVTRAVMNDMARQATYENVPVRDVQFTRELETPTQRADRASDAQFMRSAFGDAGEVIIMEMEPTAHLGAEVRPGEVFRGDPSISRSQAELAAIKQRLFAESERDLSLALVRAHKELTPFGTTVIPGIEQGHLFTVANALTEAERVLQGGTFEIGKSIMNQAVHYRPDGLADIAIYGDRSPLMNKTAREQFRQYGYFEGQEVSWNGANYAIAEFPGAGRIEGGSSRARSIYEILRREGLSDQARKDLILKVNEGTDGPVLLRSPDGSEFSVMRSELRRPPYVNGVGEPFAAELHTTPYTIGDVINIIGKEQVLNPLAAATARQHFHSYTALVKGLEPRSLTTGEPTGPYTTSKLKFSPGINMIPLYDRFHTLQDLGIAAGPENTMFLYADPTGKPVGFMEVQSVFNFGFPGTYKQILQGAEKITQGKHASAVVSFIIDPDAPMMLQGRAALSLMERANELGVSQLLSPVDEAGARLAARYMNRYLPLKKEITNIRARVQETAFDANQLYEDFKVYHANGSETKRFGERAGFDAIVETFARERGFLPEEVAGLKQHLAYKMAKEAREIYFTPEEQAIYDRLTKAMHPFEAVARQLPLDYLAVSNDMLAQWTANGTIEVRARESGELLGRFRNEVAAREFINGSGQAEGPHLDGGGRRNAIPPSAVGGSIMPPAPPRPPTNAVADGLGASYLPPGGRLPRIADWLRTQLEYLSPMEGWISAIDNSFQTRFNELVFRPTQAAWRRAQSPMLDYLRRLHREVDVPFFKGLTEEQRALVFRAMETMTPDEVISKGFYRPLNQNEINISNWLASKHIDTARTLKYSRELLDLEDLYAGDPEALNMATAELTQKYNLDTDHVIAAQTFNEIRKKNPQEIFIGHITRLADAIMSDAPSRADFIKQHGLPNSTHEAIRRLESILDEVATRVGIPEERRIRGWIAHFRAQMEPKGTLTQAFLGQRGLSDLPEMKFLNELARTGEISMVELDPVIAATRYVRGAFLSQEAIPTWNAALKASKAELAKLPKGAQQKVERVLQSYLSELRGIPEASVQFTDEIVRRLTTEMGLELNIDFRKNVVNTIIAASSAGTMALRLAMGLRDFVSGAAVGTTWFGPKRFSRMLKLGWDDAAVQSLREKGLIPPGLTPIEFSSPVDLQSSVLLNKMPAVLNRTADLGLRASLQPLVYDRLNAGAFLETHELASSTFMKLSEGKLTKEAAYRELSLDMYEPEFIRQFDTLVSASKFEDAATLIATQTQRMITPTYGMANHAYKWGTNTGRLIGQFGTWPTWLVTSLLRMTTRGSAATRFKILSRLAMTQAAIYLTGKALGFDLYSWFLLTGLRWLGGPTVGTVRAVANLFSPSEQEQASSRLELSRLVPSFSDPRSLYIPGSYALGDWLQAVGALGDPERTPSNPVEFLGRGIGIPVAKEPSWLDHLLGQ